MPMAVGRTERETDKKDMQTDGQTDMGSEMDWHIINLKEKLGDLNNFPNKEGARHWDSHKTGRLIDGQTVR